MKRDIRGFFKSVDNSQSTSLSNLSEHPAYEVNEDLGSQSEEELELRLEESQDATEVNEMDERKLKKKIPKERYATFKKEYSKEFSDLSASKKGDLYFYCNLCEDDLLLRKSAKNSIESHFKTKKHQDRVNEHAKNRPLEAFLTVTPRIEKKIEYQARLAEACMAYHVVKCGQAFTSLDCLNDDLTEIAPDSEILKEYKCKRMKGTAIIKHVIAPELKAKWIKGLKDAKFGVLTDASNHGETKMFPLIIRFSQAGKVSNFLLEVKELPGETAEMISGMIIDSLLEEKYELDINNFYVYGADNTNTNFGGPNQKEGQNVLTLLRQQKSDLHGQGCFGHVIHNTASKAADELTMDFESFVLKVYSFFNGQTKRSVALQEFCAFVEVEYLKPLRHSPIRWLTLKPDIERSLELWPALKSMFDSEENLPRIIREFVNSSKSLCTGYFLVSILNDFTETTLELERNDLTIPDTWQALDSFVMKLNTRLENEFFGFKVEEEFDFLVENGYDLEMNELKREFMVQQLNKTFKKLEEIGEFEKFKKMRCSEKWQTLLKNEKLTQICKIIDAIFTIPCSNAIVERIFSLIKAQWTDARNRLHLSTVSSIVQAKFNSENMSCVQMKKFLEMIENIDEKISSASHRSE
uniref:HAT C-terminal dimerisation domain-containing protein n=1 Tax=Acrobeloides nanus TaxID=290746 RepID=A0A914E5F1_9BILA